ncbi:MAG: hypothetical protein IJ447_02025 [Clostridia bacterium]|nr:hypothetical protein [Clostridia bacterium]
MTREVPCPSCGQLVICTVPDDNNYTEKEYQQHALSICTCPMGRKVRATEAQIAEAQDNINMLCGEGAEGNSMTPIESEDVHTILKMAVKLVSKGTIFDLTVRVSGGGTVKISAGTKGQIKVKRTVGFSEQLEANQKL